MYKIPKGFHFLRESGLAVPGTPVSRRIAERLTLTEAKSNGQLRIVLPATVLDTENLNHRTYPTKVMKKAIESKEFRAKMEGGYLLCSGDDHPDTPYVKPILASHLVTNAFIKKIEGVSYLMNEWLTLPTDNGRNLRGVFEGGAAIGVSIRGFGRSADNESSASGVIEEYEYLGTDAVGEPSAKLYAGIKVPHVEVLECVTPKITLSESRAIVEDRKHYNDKDEWVKDVVRLGLKLNADKDTAWNPDIPEVTRASWMANHNRGWIIEASISTLGSSDYDNFDDWKGDALDKGYDVSNDNGVFYASRNGDVRGAFDKNSNSGYLESRIVESMEVGKRVKVITQDSPYYNKSGKIVKSYIVSNDRGSMRYGVVFDDGSASDFWYRDLVEESFTKDNEGWCVVTAGNKVKAGPYTYKNDARTVIDRNPNWEGLSILWGTKDSNNSYVKTSASDTRNSEATECGGDLPPAPIIKKDDEEDTHESVKEAFYSNKDAWINDMKEHGAASFEEDGSAVYAYSSEKKILGVWSNTENQGITIGESKSYAVGDRISWKDIAYGSVSDTQQASGKIVDIQGSNITVVRDDDNSTEIIDVSSINEARDKKSYKVGDTIYWDEEDPGEILGRFTTMSGMVTDVQRNGYIVRRDDDDTEELIQFSWVNEAVYSDFNAWKIGASSFGAVTFTTKDDDEYAQDPNKKIVGIWSSKMKKGLTGSGVEAMISRLESKSVFKEWIDNYYLVKKTATTAPGGDDGHTHNYDPLIKHGITGPGGPDSHTHVFSISLGETAPGGTDGHTHLMDFAIVPVESLIKSSNKDKHSLIENINSLVSHVHPSDFNAILTVAKNYLGYLAKDSISIESVLNKAHWKTLESMQNVLCNSKFSYITHSSISNTEASKMKKIKEEILGGDEVSIQSPNPNNATADKDSADTLGGDSSDENQDQGPLNATADEDDAPLLGGDSSTSQDESDNNSTSESKKKLKEDILDADAGGQDAADSNKLADDDKDELPVPPISEGALGGHPVAASIISTNQHDRVMRVVPNNPDHWQLVRDILKANGATLAPDVPGEVRVVVPAGVLDPMSHYHINDVSANPLPVSPAAMDSVRNIVSAVISKNGKAAGMRKLISIESELSQLKDVKKLSEGVKNLDNIKNELFGSSLAPDRDSKMMKTEKISDDVNNLAKIIVEASKIVSSLEKSSVSPEVMASVKSLVEYVQNCEDLVARGASLLDTKDKEVSKLIEGLHSVFVTDTPVKNLSEALDIIQQSGKMIGGLKSQLNDASNRTTTIMTLIDNIRVFYRKEFNTLKKRNEASTKLVEALRSRIRLMVDTKESSKYDAPKDIAEAADAVIAKYPALRIFREELIKIAKKSDDVHGLAKKYLGIRETSISYTEAKDTRKSGTGERSIVPGMI